jgi:hypothetical protein
MREPASSQVHVWIVRPALRDSPGFGSRLRGRRRPRACPTNVETPGTGPPGPVEGFVEGTVSHNEHRPSLQFRSCGTGAGGQVASPRYAVDDIMPSVT